MAEEQIGLDVAYIPLPMTTPLLISGSKQRAGQLTLKTSSSIKSAVVSHDTVWNECEQLFWPITGFSISLGCNANKLQGSEETLFVDVQTVACYSATDYTTQYKV